MEGQYIVLGAGGHAKIVLDILQQNHQSIVGLIAKENTLKECMGYPVLGTDEMLLELFHKGISYAAMGIGHVGNPYIRNKVYKIAKECGFCFPNVIHKSASISSQAILMDGILVNSGAVINAEATIRENCIINSNAVIEHDVYLEEGIHIAPGAIVLGAAHVGENTFVGAASVILPGVSIGRDCVIGAGSVVLKNVGDGCVIAGNPAKLLRRK